MVKQLKCVWLTTTTTKYMSTLIASTTHFYHMVLVNYHVVLVKFYWDVITRSSSQLINTLIDTFFSKFCAFLAEQRRRKVSDGKRKLDGAVEESSADRKIHKSDATVCNL